PLRNAVHAPVDGRLRPRRGSELLLHIADVVGDVLNSAAYDVVRQVVRTQLHDIGSRPRVDGGLDLLAVVARHAVEGDLYVGVVIVPLRNQVFEAGDPSPEIEGDTALRQLPALGLGPVLP